MKIILSPAKKMRVDPDSLEVRGLPVFLDQAKLLLEYLRGLSFDGVSRLWGCSRSLAETNYQRLQKTDLRRNLTPAILAYEGIQYQYMAPSVLEEAGLEYLQEHLAILSGLYGVLKPFDGVVPYRLEMQAKARPDGAANLYDFWGDLIFRQVTEKDGVVLNLASREYSRCVEAYLTPKIRFVTCIFGEEQGARVVQKGTLAKMARGEMVRFAAEQKIEDPEQLRSFDRLGYCFCEQRSTSDTLVFVK